MVRLRGWRGEEVADICGCREVMRCIECDVYYDRLWEDRWAAESGEHRCFHLGG